MCFTIMQLMNSLAYVLPGRCDRANEVPPFFLALLFFSRRPAHDRTSCVRSLCPPPLVPWRSEVRASRPFPPLTVLPSHFRLPVVFSSRRVCGCAICCAGLVTRACWNAAVDLRCFYPSRYYSTPELQERFTVTTGLFFLATCKCGTDNVARFLRYSDAAGRTSFVLGADHPCRRAAAEKPEGG